MSKNLSAKYQEENKEKQQKKGNKIFLKRYRNLSIEEKEKKRQYGCERYKNLPKDEKINWLSIEKNGIE